jgi:dTDP-4-amino-4,6-dideoxygalactose transaminase
MSRDPALSRRQVLRTTAAAGSAFSLAALATSHPAAAAPATQAPPADADLPAIAGGKPIKTTPFGRVKRYGEAELQQLREAIEQQTLFYAQGKKVKALEAAFAKRHGVKHAIACSSGTAAIHSAMIALGISPGDEVIVTPITDMGSIIPILFQGAVPVFADLDPHTYNLAPADVERRITDKTKAILAVHLAGNACDMKALKRIADERKLVLIEDCAQAFGCQYDGKPIGTIGRAGCFSFNEYKHVSCGDGGIIITDDDALARRLRLATDKCVGRTGSKEERQPTFLANNYRMTELQGAVAVAQLGKLDSIVERRRAWCDKLHAALRDLPGIALPQVTPGCDASWWFYMVRVDPKVLGADAADALVAAMKAEGVPLGAHYIGEPIYAYPLFKNHSAFARGTPHAFASFDYKAGLCPVAEAILDTCVMLTVHEGYTDEDLDQTVRAFRRVAAWMRDKAKNAAG